MTPSAQRVNMCVWGGLYFLDKMKIDSHFRLREANVKEEPQIVYFLE